jgi:hypothetical protein
MKTNYAAGDVRITVASDYLPYVDEVIMRDPVIVTHNDTAAKKIRSSCVKKRLPRPDDAELHEFFRAHWREWVRLSMKTVRARPNPAPTVVTSQQSAPLPTVLPLPTAPQSTQQSAIAQTTLGSPNDGPPTEMAKLVLAGFMGHGELGTYKGMLAFVRELFGQPEHVHEMDDEVQQPFPGQC